MRVLIKHAPELLFHNLEAEKQRSLKWQMQNQIKSRPRWIRLETTSKSWRRPEISHLSYQDTFEPQCWEQMNYYMFLHFKSDILPHLTPPFSPLFPFCSKSLSPFQSWIDFYLLTSSVCILLVSLLFYIPWSFAFSHFLSPSPAISMISFILTIALFSFSLFSCFPCSLPLFPNIQPLCQSLCARGHFWGCRQLALCRRRSTRQGRGVRIHCSQGTDFMSCPGPPIARTCCMSMPPGKTSNRAKPPPTTSEIASHCPGWLNSICCCIDLLDLDVHMDCSATEMAACPLFGNLIALGFFFFIFAPIIHMILFQQVAQQSWWHRVRGLWWCSVLQQRTHTQHSQVWPEDTHQERWSYYHKCQLPWHFTLPLGREIGHWPGCGWEWPLGNLRHWGQQWAAGGQPGGSHTGMDYIKI